MTTITLHKYLQKIEEFIDDRQYDEAIAHCRHILEQFPRHVDTYRTLAKVYLERGNYEDAIDLTQRVLSTDPSDLIAHVALSVAYKEQSDLDRSIYHLQRALDVEPYNNALREELNEIYMANETAVPESIAPSSAALARMYLKSEMYNVAIAELRQALVEDPDRMDLKVLLAETLWRANERVGAVSLSLEILDQLPNCIPVNAVLAEIWLQTGRVAEAQTYLKRLQALVQLDKANCDVETAVGRAFSTRGAFSLPDEVSIEPYSEEILPEISSETDEPTIATVNSDWINEFSLEETGDLPDVTDEDGKTSDWLTEAALATGENFGTQPLVMPNDPLQAETDWLAAAGEDEDESLDDLLDDVDDGAELADWLTSTLETNEPDLLESTGFTGMLSGLLDSELEIADDTAVSPDFSDLFDEADEPLADIFAEETTVPPSLTDLFDEISESPTEDETKLDEIDDLDLDLFLTGEDDDFSADTDEEMADTDSFAEGLTALFSDMDSPAAEPIIEDDDINLDEFLSVDLDKEAETETSSIDDDPTGYTELFDDLSTDAFPDEPQALDSDWLLTPAAKPDLDLSDLADGDEDMPDWLSAGSEVASKSVDDALSLDDLVDSDELVELAGDDWLTAFAADDELAAEAVEPNDDWLADLAGGEPETAAADSQPLESGELADIPTWMLGGEQEDPSFESAAPIDFAESVGFETDELEDDTAVPTWLLGGDLASEETGDLDEADLDAHKSPQDLLAGEELPDWLQHETEETAVSEPLQTDDILSTPEADLPDWLSTDAPEPEAEVDMRSPLDTDSMADLAGEEFPSWLADDVPDTAAKPIPEPDSELDLYKDDINIPEWLSTDLPESAELEAEPSDPLGTDSMENLAAEELPSWLTDEEPDLKARPIPEPDSEFDLYKDDLNIPDWLITDLSTGQDQAEVAVTDDKDEQEPTLPQDHDPEAESMPEAGDDDGLDWLADLAALADEPEEDSASFASRVAAGEGPAVEEPPTQVSMPDELPDAGFDTSDLQWLEDLSEDLDTETIEDQVTLDWSQPEAGLDDVLAGVTGELNADLDWLDSLAAESDSGTELVDEIADEFDSGTGLLGDLDDDAGPLDLLGDDPILPDFEDSLAVLPDEPDDDLDWLSELAADEDLADEADELVEMDEALVAETAVAPATPETPEPEMPAIDEPPEDMDDAMAWLESLAAGQGAKLEELPSLADELTTEPAAKPEPAEALNWMDSLDIEEEIAEIEPAVGLETDYSSVSEPEAVAEATDAEAPADDLVLDDLDDMDDAMAWLESLAAKQGARLEELPSLADEDLPELESAAESDVEQLDDELDWLGDLAGETAGEFASDSDDVDILLDFDLGEDGLQSLEETLDWMEAVEEPEVVAAEPESVEPVEPADEAEVAEVVDAPASMDDAMIWLEALAADQETEETETAVPDEPEPDMPEPVAEEPADLDEAMGWLEDLAAEQASPLEDLPTIAGVIDELPALEPAPRGSVESPDELTEALDWLEQMALADGASLAAVPVQETAVSTDENDLDEALDWLEQLAQSEEKETVPIEDATDEILDLGDLSDAMPEDPDEALAWLQQVAAEQEFASAELDDDFSIESEIPVVEGEPKPEPEASVPEPELESIIEPDTEFEELAVPEIEGDILAEMPDDPDAAMAWLEQLAARQGADLEELPSVSEEDMEAITAASILELSAEPETAVGLDTDDDVADLFAEIEQDVDLPEFEDGADESLDWLEMDEETAVAPEIEPAAEPDIDTAETEMPVADLTELEVPEDMDDAMAWLEALAAQQGAKLEELPTLSGTDERPPKVVEDTAPEKSLTTPDADLPDDDSGLLEDIDEALPDWLTADTDSLKKELSVAVEKEPVEDDDDSDSDLPDWLAPGTDSLDKEPPALVEEALAEDDADILDDIGEALPDWLSADDDSLDQMPGQTQWLTALDEPDIGGWLDEEEATISSSYDRTVQTRFESQPESTFETGPLSPTTGFGSDMDLFSDDEVAIDTPSFSLDDEKLESARQAVAQGQFDNALHGYQALVDAGGGMMALIADLEMVSTEHPEQPLFRHLLGDAYMRNGQLQKALDTYRMALDQI